MTNLPTNDDEKGVNTEHPAGWLSEKVVVQVSKARRPSIALVFRACLIFMPERGQ